MIWVSERPMGFIPFFFKGKQLVRELPLAKESIAMMLVANASRFLVFVIKRSSAGSMDLC